MAYLYEKYKKETLPALMKEFQFHNLMEAPRIEKVVVNCGFGRLVSGKSKEEQKKFKTQLYAILVSFVVKKRSSRKPAIQFLVLNCAKDKLLVPKSLYAVNGCGIC